MRLHLAFRRYSRTFRTPLRTGRGPWAERTGLVLRLANEAGQVGWGEAAPIPWFPGATVEELSARLAAFGDYADDADLREVFAGGTGRFAVHSALAQLAGEALTPALPAVPVAALLPAGEAARSVLRQRLEEGFRTFKWKVGVLSPSDEWALLDDLLGDLPAQARLRLDANGSWDRITAERWLGRAADRPIDYIEQPTAAEGRTARDLLLGLAHDYPTALALDESLGDEHQVKEWLDLGWPGVWVLKLPLLGDPLDVLHRLDQRKARVVFSSAIEGPVARRRCWQIIFSRAGACAPVGYGLGELFGEATWDGPPLLPFWRPTDQPVFDPEALWQSLA